MDLLDKMNKASYAFRWAMRWSRPGYVEHPKPKDPFFAQHPALAAQEQQLLATYPGLASLRAQSTLSRYLENLNLVEALETVTNQGSLLTLPAGDTPPAVLEVGAKNWSMVHGLAVFLHQHWGETITLTGIELDPWRVYRDLHSRWDYARYYAQQVPHAQYLAGDVLAHQGAYALVACFLPFVFPDPLRAWGLPKRFFQPEAFFRHLVINLLKPGGYLMLTNQGPAEFDAQAQYLAPFSLTCHYAGPIPQSFLTLKYPRYGWLLQKPPTA